MIEKKQYPAKHNGRVLSHHNIIITRPHQALPLSRNIVDRKLLIFIF